VNDDQALLELLRVFVAASKSSDPGVQYVVVVLVVVGVAGGG